MLTLIRFRGEIVGTWDPDRTTGAADGTGPRTPAPLHVRGGDADEHGPGVRPETFRALEGERVWSLVGAGADPTLLIGGRLTFSAPRGPAGRIMVDGATYDDVAAAVAAGIPQVAGGILAAGVVERAGPGAAWEVIEPAPGPAWSIE